MCQGVRVVQLTINIYKVQCMDILFAVCSGATGKERLLQREEG